MKFRHERSCIKPSYLENPYQGGYLLIAKAYRYRNKFKDVGEEY